MKQKSQQVDVRLRLTRISVISNVGMRKSSLRQATHSLSDGSGHIVDSVMRGADLLKMTLLAKLLSTINFQTPFN